MISGLLPKENKQSFRHIITVIILIFPPTLAMGPEKSNSGRWTPNITIRHQNGNPCLFFFFLLNRLGQMKWFCVNLWFVFNREWKEDLLQEACRLLAEEMNLSPSVPGGMVDFRRTLVLSFFFKFYLTVLQKRSVELNGNVSSSVFLMG